jgi:hypothetical protein
MIHKDLLFIGFTHRIYCNNRADVELLTIR